MGLNDLDPIDFLIEDYIRERFGQERLSLKAIRKKFKVHPSRVRKALERVVPLYRGPAVFRDANGRWGRLSALEALYGLDKSNIAPLMKAVRLRGGEIRKRNIYTDRKPFAGESFYNLDDIERWSVRIARRAEVIKERLLHGNPTVRSKPAQLSEFEYQTLIALCETCLEKGPAVSVREVCERLGLKQGNEMGVRKQIHRLRSKGFIDFRYPMGPVYREGKIVFKGYHKPYEYRILSAPAYYKIRLSQRDRSLTQPFREEKTD